jgi:DNA-binding LacI/PurR family transcriptional regulator
MARRLKDGFTCDILICGHDYPAVGALRAVLDAGIRVPDEMAILSELRGAVAGAAPMELTTFDVHPEIQGQLAAEALMRRIEGYDGPYDVHHVPCEMIEGETT